MAVFKTNFLAGILVGAVFAVAIPLAGTEVFATLSDSAQAAPQPVVQQIVNRAGKTDRLHPAHNAIGRSSPKASKILEGCDPAFSPLSKGVASNYSSRCLT
jgi:hypothetical protein